MVSQRSKHFLWKQWPQGIWHQGSAPSSSISGLSSRHTAQTVPGVIESRSVIKEDRHGRVTTALLFSRRALAPPLGIPKEKAATTRKTTTEKKMSPMEIAVTTTKLCVCEVAGPVGTFSWRLTVLPATWSGKSGWGILTPWEWMCSAVHLNVNSRVRPPETLWETPEAPHTDNTKRQTDAQFMLRSFIENNAALNLGCTAQSCCTELTVQS